MKPAAWFLTAILALPGLAAPPVDDYFPLKSGASWTYHREPVQFGTAGDYTRRVSAVDHGVYTVTLEGTGLRLEQHYSKTATGVVRLDKVNVASNIAVKYVPPQQILPLRPRVGENWDWKGVGTVTSWVGLAPLGQPDPHPAGEPTQDTHTTEHSKVVGMDSIKTAAGVFFALHVHITATVAKGPSEESDVWYAKGVGLVKVVGVEPFAGTQPYGPDAGRLIRSTTELIHYQL